jgi:hypothetical protein
LRHLFPYLSAPNKRRGRRLRLLVLLFLVVVFFYIWNTRYAPQEEKTAYVVQEKVIDRTGEKIEYNVYLGTLKVGKATYHHLRKTFLHDKQVELITFLTEAVRFKDRETIYADSDTFLPLVVERKISKPIKPEKIREEYDQENFKLTITKKRFGQSVKEIKSTKPIHNSILLPFFVRTAEDLNIGWTFTANLPQGEYLIKLTKIEKVNTPAGEFEAYFFESDPNKFKIWIGTDSNRIPLRIDGTGGIGYKMMMQTYTPPGKTE